MVEVIMNASRMVYLRTLLVSKCLPSAWIFFIYAQGVVSGWQVVAWCLTSLLLSTHTKYENERVDKGSQGGCLDRDHL